MRRIVAGLAGVVALIVFSAGPAWAAYPFSVSSSPAGATVLFDAYTYNYNGQQWVYVGYVVKDTRADGQCAHAHISIDLVNAPDPAIDDHVCGNGLSKTSAWNYQTNQTVRSIKVQACRWQPGVYQPGCGILAVGP